MTHKSRHEQRCKATVALCLAGFAIATAATMLIAAARVTPVVDAEYYTHGLHYHAQPAQWSITPSLLADALSVAVHDGKGAPVSGGRLEYRLETAQGQTAVPLLLKETSPGVYFAKCAASGGDVSGTLCFSKGDEKMSKKMVLFH